MEKKVLLKILILLLGFSYVLSVVTAAPVSRSLNLVGEAYSSTNQPRIVAAGCHGKNMQLRTSHFKR
ncbi:hypothetical protein MKX01_016976 [Papaver californicum]|nr:hypothetical protein MKX01_016976 [Papaver californicum]